MLGVRRTYIMKKPGDLSGLIIYSKPRTQDRFTAIMMRCNRATIAKDLFIVSKNKIGGEI